MKIHFSTDQDCSRVLFSISSGETHFELDVQASDKLLSRIIDPDEFQDFILSNCFRNNIRSIKRIES